MKLIEDLGSKDYLSPRTNTVRKEHVGLFYCPVCKRSDIERPIHNGKKSTTCGKGCKDNGCTKHNKCDTAIYRAWANMKNRCNNPSHNSYEHYGAKGISYTPDWETFEGFFKDMGLAYKEGLTIDRIKTSEDYSKDNCQWITMHVNRVKDQIKEIAKYSKDDIKLAIFPSSHEAARMEYPEITEVKRIRAIANSIARVARGERKQYKGFLWKYI